MSESGFNHKQIQTISIIHNMLSIQFGFKTSILEDNKASFLILNRKTESEKYLPFHTLDDENTIGSYEVTIDLHKEKDFLDNLEYGMSILLLSLKRMNTNDIVS
ncbi:hypothetical protein AAHH67_06635 [Niallia circulans]